MPIKLSLPASFRFSETDWKSILISGDKDLLAKHLALLLADFQSMPFFLQRLARRSLTEFIRTKRPLPLELTESYAFSLPETRPNWTELQLGDMVFVRPHPAIFQGFLWAMHYSHIGIYARPGFMLEVNVDKGVRLCPLKLWKRSRAHMGLARLAEPFLSQIGDRMPQIMEEAIQRWCNRGYKYNLAMWKEAGTVPEKFYCSELVWQIFMDEGIDLRDDATSAHYVEWVRKTFGDWAADGIAEPAIAPDELALSPKIEFYSVGLNR